MRALTVGMCLGAFLAFGVAKAGEARQVTAPAGYQIIDPDARISSALQPESFQIVDADHLLVRVNVRDLYMAELPRYCLREAEFHPAIAFESEGNLGIDKFAHVRVGRERCALLSFTRVERVPAPEAPAPNH